MLVINKIYFYSFNYENFLKNFQVVLEWTDKTVPLILCLIIGILIGYNIVSRYKEGQLYQMVKKEAPSGKVKTWSISSPYAIARVFFGTNTNRQFFI